jgi:predicted O-linked N-acetylglucosamine transferase (SPINDLY family)
VREGEESYYSETVLRMPQDYICYGPPEDAPIVSPLPAKSAGYVTFGCFNNPMKYSDACLTLWSRVLHANPASRLLLKFGGLDLKVVREGLIARFATKGIGRDRLLIEGGAAHGELLASYHRVDLALDTLPYSGGLTTCEALWMGVPVLTMPGKTFAGRHSTSHLTNAGLDQFVARDADHFVELATAWAQRLDELAHLRHEMREMVRRSPLCDAERYAADFCDLLMGKLAE